MRFPEAVTQAAALLGRSGDAKGELSRKSSLNSLVSSCEGGAGVLEVNLPRGSLGL